jgi:hypothetical protein
MARAYGSNASLLLKREANYGEQPTGDYYRMPFNSNSLSSEQGLIEDTVLGFGRDPLQPLQDLITDTGDIGVPVDPRYLGIWLTGLLGDPTSGDVAASGYIDFSDQPSAGDTITINGQAFAFVDDAPSGEEILIGGTIVQTLSNITARLNNSTDADINIATYSRPNGTQRLLIVHDTAGVAGNSFTLAAQSSVAKASASTLQGGGTQHEFISGKQNLPSYTLQVGMPEVPAFFVHTGVVINTLAFDFQTSGAAAVTVSAIAQAENRYDASQGGTPQELVFSRIGQPSGSIKSEGQNIANLTAGSVTYTNNAETIQTIRNDGLIDGVDPTIAALTGTIEARFSDTILIDKATSGTPVDLEFSYTLTPGLIFKMIAHQVHLPKPQLPVDGSGGVQASFDFQGAFSQDAGRMLTVQLLNDIDGSDYL